MKRDAVTVERVVAVDPARAFAAFTDEIDGWWRRGSRFRWLTRGGALAFEGGQLVERCDKDAFVVGAVLAWEPPHRLVFEWRAPTFVGDEVTEVEIRFVAEAGRTRVLLEHRGWSRIRRDHPARGGTKETPAFQGLFGLYWADLLGAFARVL